MFTLRDIHDMDEAVSGKSNNNYVLDASKLDIRALQRDLEQIEDPRGGQGRRYRFMLSGGKEYVVDCDGGISEILNEE